MHARMSHTNVASGEMGWIVGSHTCLFDLGVFRKGVEYEWMGASDTVRTLCCEWCGIALLVVDVLDSLPDVIHGNDGKERAEDLADLDAKVSEQINRNQSRARMYPSRSESPFSTSL